MSFIVIADRIINLMTISLVEYNEGDDYAPSELLIHISGMPAALSYHGDLADESWVRLRSMAVPLRRV
jgi:hypothetical protein